MWDDLLTWKSGLRRRHLFRKVFSDATAAEQEMLLPMIRRITVHLFIMTLHQNCRFVSSAVLE